MVTAEAQFFTTIDSDEDKWWQIENHMPLHFPARAVWDMVYKAQVS